MVIAPGGSYKVLSMYAEGSDIAAWLNSIGVSAFVLKYRVPGRTWLPFGAAELMDAQRAVGLVRQMAGTYGLNKSKIGFIGFSAGGHLTGHLNVAWQSRTYPRVDAADDESCKPDAAIMVSSVEVGTGLRSFVGATRLFCFDLPSGVSVGECHRSASQRRPLTGVRR
jgi:acetyl esterase/lipase